MKQGQRLPRVLAMNHVKVYSRRQVGLRQIRAIGALESKNSKLTGTYDSSGTISANPYVCRTTMSRRAAEERKKKYSSGGMKYTAEAMMRQQAKS